MDLHLNNKQVLVTGGSSGIGAAIVKTFLKEGANVHFCAREQGKIDALLNELKDYQNVYAKRLDVTNEAEFRSWVSGIGQIDILIANVSALSGDWKPSIQTDLIATVSNIETVVPLMNRDIPAVTFIGSISASVSEPQGNAYGAIKAAVTHYIQSLSKQYAGQIRFNMVAPTSTLFAGGSWDKYRLSNPEKYQDKVERMPMKRLATPEEVASTVVFVSSPLASFISGEVIHVDGGERHSIDL
ncbi:SDR family NAD(P)-dependent oxidoreductase [Vibrio superstes]|uniref:3-ketoacyl-ACP reductase n=1 Tax=Vibrio superstes NBRC 103154 TaxID=1219062 RepID=A0A511QTG8_9VIBR|nr:SDR family oxidoreductase [Vibrio superstes]GEM80357.1 3-ketoacyl-ACP reductase [Vibrio superstes NBRC 103154]